MLEWTNPEKPDGVSYFYDHCHAHTAFGPFGIEWKSWKDYPGFTLHFAGNYISSHTTLDEAKLAALDWFQDRLRAPYSRGGSKEG